MTGFMNAEIASIRDNLKCGHCGAIFKGTDSQGRKVKYENRVVYCSNACSYAAKSKNAQLLAIAQGKKPRKGILAGPCKTCGKMFESRIDKIYCTIDCYTKSDQFREIQSQYWAPSKEVKKRISEALKKGENVPCLECGNDFYRKLSDVKTRKFCTKVCYRSFMAKRFDRWIANPESMSLPQCYDEFLDKEQLRCVVEGCDWEGVHLTNHMNLAHGVLSSDFKRAAGFNLSTGVVARPLAEYFQSRPLRGIALDAPGSQLELAREAKKGSYIRYRSLEAKEHHHKARSLLTGPGPERTCKGCGNVFQQSTLMGKALYCSRDCRSIDYAKKNKEKAKTRIRQKDGTFKWKEADITPTAPTNPPPESTHTAAPCGGQTSP